MPTFGDKVRIKTTNETTKHRSAGQLGEILGEPVPSGTGIDYGTVVGGTAEDLVLFVKLDSGSEGWFAASLVEFVDHQAGRVISIDGGPTFRRLPDGTWQQEGRSKGGALVNPSGGVLRRTRPRQIARFLRWLGRPRPVKAER